MKQWVQPPTPWDKSLHWALHDAWFAARGTAAWSDGDVPCEATSGHASAMVHADFLLRQVARLEADALLAPGEPVWVLEVGGGNGQFAETVLLVLEVAFGEPGRALLSRLRWVWSDYQERTVREATARAGLVEAVAAGRVVPALLDLREPLGLRLLDTELSPGKWLAVYANYVACVVSTRILRWRPHALEELCVGLAADVADEREAAALREVWLENPTQEGLLDEVSLDWSWQASEREEPALERLRARLPTGTASWPTVFVDFVCALREQLHPGGAIVVSDFGSASFDEIRGQQEPRPRHYGNTNNTGVDFAVFEAVAHHENLGLLRTEDPLRSIHHAAFFVDEEQAEASWPAFFEVFVDQRIIDDWLDYTAAAEVAEKDELEDETMTALRWWERCIALAPHDPSVFTKLGELGLDAELWERAEEALMHARALDVYAQHDTAFHLGRLCAMRNRSEEAIGWYRLSLAFEEHAVTWSNLAGMHEQLGDREAAIEGYRRALAQDPEHKRSRKRLNALT